MKINVFFFFFQNALKLDHPIHNPHLLLLCSYDLNLYARNARLSALYNRLPTILSTPPKLSSSGERGSSSSSTTTK